MSEAVLVACISGGVSLLGTLLAGWVTAKKTDQSIRTSQAVTESQVKELAREVREHNNFARRMPVVEEQIKVINHRLGDLEKYHK